MSQWRDRSCRVAVFQGPGSSLEIQEFAVPQPAEHEALVEVLMCTICGSDLHTFQGKRNEPTPAILGHEILGRVTEVGDPPLVDVDGNPLREGDRVIWSTCVSCSNCDRCAAGLPQKCRSLSKYGHAVAEGRYALSGGLAELVLLRCGSAVIRLDDDLDDRIVCPAGCATATIAAAYRNAERISGKRVLILGAGMLGMTAAAFGKWRGASSVTVCDVDQTRLRRALAMGADHIVEWQSNDLGLAPPEIILECSGAPAAVELACKVGGVGSKVILVGSVMPSPAVAFDPQHLVRTCSSIHGVHNYAPQDLSTAVQFLAECSDQFPFVDLVEMTYPLSRVNDAFAYAIENHPVRVAVRP